MEKLIARVTAGGGRASLTRLITAPLGLDVWEVKPDHLVVQADEAQAARLEAMGYGVEQLDDDRVLPVRLRHRPGAGRATTRCRRWRQDLRRLAEDNPEIAELHEIGRSVEGRPIWALRIGVRRGNRARCCSWAATTPASGSRSRCRTGWLSTW